MCVLVLVMVVFGLGVVALATGKIQISKNKTLHGRAARKVGLVLVLQFPLLLLCIFRWFALKAAQ